MSHDPIDQTLLDEPEITPSADVAWKVMRSVRHEADREEALPFPLKRLAAGLALSAALTLVGVLFADPAPAPTPNGSPVPLTAGLAWLITSLTAAFGVAWWSVRSGGR